MSQTAPPPATEPLLTANTTDLRLLPIEKLVPSKTNPRRHFDKDTLKELTASIKAEGIINPILVRPIPGKPYEIVAGERRYRAAKKAGLEEVPVLIRELDDAHAMELQEKTNWLKL